MEIEAGPMIRDARLAAGLSQGELALIAGVTQPVVSAYERGVREPGVAMLEKLLQAAGHRLEMRAVPMPGSVRGIPASTLGRRLRRHRQAVLHACERKGATNVRLFGSVARGEDTESSDIDLLVDLDDSVGLVGLIELELELESLLGSKVDVVPAADLKPGIADGPLRDAIAL